MNISSTQFSRNLGKYLEEAITDPIIIEKYGRSSIVIMSYKKYIEFNTIYNEKKYAEEK
jgi:prevent-host-death family protein